jgi:hypothetical protein
LKGLALATESLTPVALGIGLLYDNGLIVYVGEEKYEDTLEELELEGVVFINSTSSIEIRIGLFM